MIDRSLHISIYIPYRSEDAAQHTSQLTYHLITVDYFHLYGEGAAFLTV